MELLISRMEVWVLGHRLRRIENPPWTLKDGLVWKKQTCDYRHLLLARTRKGKSDVCNSTGFVLISFGNLTFLKEKDMASASSSLHISQFAKSAKGCAAGLRPQCQTLDFYEKLGTSMKFLFGDFNARIDSHALLTIPGSLVIRGCLDTKVDVLALQETWEKIMWDKTFLEMSIWAQTSVQRLLALPVCFRQMDGFPLSCFRRILQIQFAFISRGSNGETLCRSLWWYCNANVLFSVKHQDLPSITFFMKPLVSSVHCNRQLGAMFGELPSARRMTPRRKTRNQNWRASTHPSEPLVRGDLGPSSDIFQEVPDQEPISKNDDRQ